ncbi:MAG TPA: quinone-dependent dihydroorotate dehydrogenase [Hyphomicrobiaceae bacterium]|nr:quinone-dependent dihydroorotate dehydrogenase [Hyphomicrobiaceae bacterium]
MLELAFELARPLLNALDPEQAHELTLRSLEAGVHPRNSAQAERLATSLWGLEFPNPIGVAAGFDKDARVAGAVLAMGFGFAEIGTVTPQPQPGNSRPRVFRLMQDRALINRLGFNNGGHAAALARLTALPPRGIAGVNVGANKDTADRAGDYVAGIRCFYDVAAYFTVNISSPNTPGLRDLQAPAALDDLLERVLAERALFIDAGKPRRPVVVKLAPDIAEADLEPIVAVLAKRGVDGIAVGNTTLSRRGVGGTHAGEAGGLSGRPLFHRSTVALARVHRLTGGRIPLVGIGGIDSGAAAIAKIEAGASLLQLYTGLVFEGPGLIGRIKRALVAYAEQEKLSRIGEATGRRAEEWAARPLEA